MQPAGEASAIFARAEATARGLQLLADAIRQRGGSEAVSLRVAEQYLDSFGEIAKQGTTMLLPAATHDPASMVASALSIYKQVAAAGAGPDGGGDGGGSGSGGAAAAGRPARPATPAEREAVPPSPRATAAGGQLPRYSLQRALE